MKGHLILLLVSLAFSFAQAKNESPLLSSSKILSNEEKAVEMSFNSLFKYFDIHCKGYVRHDGTLVVSQDPRPCKVMEQIREHIALEEEMSRFASRSASLFKKRVDGTVILQPEYLRSGYWSFNPTVSQQQKLKIVTKLMKWSLSRHYMVDVLDDLSAAMEKIGAQNPVSAHMVALLHTWISGAGKFEKNYAYYNGYKCTSCAGGESRAQTINSILLSNRDKLSQAIAAVKAHAAANLISSAELNSFLFVEKVYGNIGLLTEEEYRAFYEDEKQLERLAYIPLLVMQSAWRSLYTDDTQLELYMTFVRLMDLASLSEKLALANSNTVSPAVPNTAFAREMQADLDQILETVQQGFGI